MANLLENALKQQMATRADRQTAAGGISEEKVKDIVSEYVQDVMATAAPRQDEDALRQIIASSLKEAMTQQAGQQAVNEQIQEAVSKAVRDAMSNISIASGDGKAVVNADNSHIQEQVDKIYEEITKQFAKQNEVINSVSKANEENKEFLADIQSRMDKQTEKNAELVAHVQEKDQALMTIDYAAMRENFANFKTALEENNQSMDQLRKQLNRERNNNDRTVTELYRSMKSSEEQIEDLHESYDEFTNVISSHKNIMGILIWLDIIIIAALIIFNVINLLP